MRILGWLKQKLFRGSGDEWARQDMLDNHARKVRHGFANQEPDFMKQRRNRSALIQRFLAIMAYAGNPGQRRYLGSTVRKLTGQYEEHYWSTVLSDIHGHRREFLVLADGRHGWGDEISYSDRPRSSDDEISPHLLHKALSAILDQYNLDWDSPTSYQPLATDQSWLDRAASLTASQELHRRQFRYGILMALRLLFLIVAGILATIDIDGLRFWILVCIAGALLLPWLAVMVANERSAHHI
jgi:hypothetical protein